VLRRAGSSIGAAWPGVARAVVDISRLRGDVVMQSFNPWVVFCSFCCVGPLFFGFIVFRLGMSVGRRGIPSLRSPLHFRQRFAAPEQPTARESILRQVREQQRGQHE